MTDTTIPAFDLTSPIRTCARCGLTYDWRRSPSSYLKMTYCGSLCERADLGFTIDAALNGAFTRVPRQPEDTRLIVPAEFPIAA